MQINRKSSIKNIAMSDNLNERISKSEIIIFGAVVISALFLALIFVFLAGKSKTGSLEDAQRQVQQQAIKVNQ